MAFFPDLSALTYLPGMEGLNFRAVAWLSPENSFNRGAVSIARFERLCLFLHDPWQPPIASGGVHSCELCRFTCGRGELTFKNYKISGISSRLLFVPSGDCIYVSPSSITHYIDAHEYCPPEEFWNALEECPPMKSPAYLKMLLDGGVREWQNRLKGSSSGDD
jgi:hypothetical protein